MADLEKQFTAAMFDLYRRTLNETGYNASKFHNMIAENEGVATAKTLINMRRPSEGYTALWERKRLDLTVEAIVVEEKRWHPLFLPEELARARKRLKDYGYEPRTSN